MTVKELIVELKKYPPTAKVVMQKDGEGNSYSPLSSVDLDRYQADSTWSGSRVDPEDDSDVFETAVFLVPVN